MSIIVLNPGADPKKYDGQLAPPLEELDGKTIGILDDGFGRNVPDTFQRIRELICDRFPKARVMYWKKPTLSQPSPRTLLTEISNSADAVIVGVAA